LLENLWKLQCVAVQVAQVRNLGVHAEHLTRVLLADGHIPRMYFSVRQTLKDAHPLRRDLDASFLDQPPQVGCLLRTRVRIYVIGDKDVVFEQETEARRPVGQLDGLGNDLVAARETFLTGATPKEVKM